MLTAADGKEGFELAKKYLPDVIVTDIMMPIMDGLELCKAVKSNIATSHIPVILLTAKDSLQDKEEGYETGADSYITKPFSAKLLSSRIKNILGARRRLASLISSKIEAKPESKPATETAAPEKEMEHPAATEIKLSKIDEAFLEKFKSIVEERIADPKLDMAFMQESMNMSHSTLYRKLKSLTGMSGNEVIRKISLKKGYEMLSDGYNVSETAYACGFDPSYFRNCVKAEYGVFPSEFVKSRNKPEQ